MSRRQKRAATSASPRRSRRARQRVGGGEVEQRPALAPWSCQARNEAHAGVEEQRKEEDEAAEESARDVKPAVVAEKAGGKKRRAATSAPSPDATKRVKKTSMKKEKVVDDDEDESKPVAPPLPSPAPAPEPGSSPRGKVDWWAARRYAAGEATPLDVLHAHGATATKPLPRADLWAQTLRHIGDTRLLNHHLPHVADKVPAGSDARVHGGRRG